MTRRDPFIKIMLQLPVLSRLFLKVVRDADNRRRIMLNTFHVAGFQYYSGPETLPVLKENDNIRLHAEPGNIYDSFAWRFFMKTDLSVMCRA